MFFGLWVNELFHRNVNQSLPGCNGLLLLCVELVLDDLEDLLLVGRLLLPVKPITGGSTAGGGTCRDHRENGWLLRTVRDAVYSVCTEVSYLPQLGKETVYFLLLAGVQGLDLTHVPRDGKMEKMRNKILTRKKEIMRVKKQEEWTRRAKCSRKCWTSLF